DVRIGNDQRYQFGRDGGVNIQLPVFVRLEPRGVVGIKSKLDAVQRRCAAPVIRIGHERDFVRAVDGFKLERTIPVVIGGIFPPVLGVFFHGALVYRVKDRHRGDVSPVRGDGVDKFDFEPRIVQRADAVIGECLFNIGGAGGGGV